MLLLVTLASAAEAPTWSWDEPRRFRMVAQHAPMLPYHLLAPNVGGRYAALGVQIDTTCTAVEPTKKGTRILCTVDVVALEAIPHDGDIGQVEPALEAYRNFMTGQRVELEMQPDGRIRRFQVVSMSEARSGAQQMVPHATLLLIEAFAPLAVELPGADETTWKQKAYNHDLSWAWSRAATNWTASENGYVGTATSSVSKVNVHAVFGDGALDEVHLVSSYTHFDQIDQFDARLVRLTEGTDPLEPRAVELDALTR